MRRRELLLEDVVGGTCGENKQLLDKTVHGELEGVVMSMTPDL
jgi:uncharacterized protein with von Willebrand factor type A (vWA) domain